MEALGYFGVRALISVEQFSENENACTHIEAAGEETRLGEFRRREIPVFFREVGKREKYVSDHKSINCQAPKIKLKRLYL